MDFDTLFVLVFVQLNYIKFKGATIMKTSHTNEIIREIAVKHGVSCEEVTSALETAIDYGRASSDPRAQLFWKGIVPEGDEPELEYLLQSLAALAVFRLANHP